MATAVLDEDRSVAAVAGQYRCGWHTVHNEVVAVAEEALDDAEPAPVRVLGIDETRRGKAKWDHDPVLGRRVWTAGVGGPLGHRPGRYHRRSRTAGVRA